MQYMFPIYGDEAAIAAESLECRDLDEAISWAARMPACGGGCVEIRPMLEMPT